MLLKNFGWAFKMRKQMFNMLSKLGLGRGDFEPK